MNQQLFLIDPPTDQLTHADPVQVLQDLYESDIHYDLLSRWDAGFFWRLDTDGGRSVNGDAFSITEAIEALGAEAVRALPNRPFATKYRHLLDIPRPLKNREPWQRLAEQRTEQEQAAERLAARDVRELLATWRATPDGKQAFERLGSQRVAAILDFLGVARKSWMFEHMLEDEVEGELNTAA